MSRYLPMNLQFFAEGEGEGSGGSAAQNQQSGNGQQGQGAASGGIDYDKLEEIFNKRSAAAGDSALKGFLKQQGLSEKEMQQAIAAFKDQKAANQPDPNALQGELTAAQKAAQQARIESMATLQAVELNIDAKTIPYVLRLADLSQAVDAEGKISDEAIKKALNKVLEDVPAFKPQPAGQQGFQFGAGGSGNGQGQADDAALKAVFGL